MEKHGERGWTLAEMVVTVGVIAVVSMMALPTLIWLRGNYRLHQVVILLTGAIREAQIQSLAGNRPWRVLIDPDGKGYSLQYADDPYTASGDCGLTGWTTQKQEAFAEGLLLDTGSMAQSCLTFASNGRAEWPVPQILIDHSDQPVDELTWTKLTDRIQIPESSPPSNPSSESTIWRQTQSPYVAEREVWVDFGASRYVEEIALGLYSRPYMDYYRYPSWIRVDATNQADSGGSGEPVPPGSPETNPSDWVDPPLYNAAGPADPTPTVSTPNPREVTELTIPVSGTYRFVRITLTTASRYLAVHEISFGDPAFTLTGPTGTRRLVINSVTGRVTVERVDP